MSYKNEQQEKQIGLINEGGKGRIFRGDHPGGGKFMGKNWPFVLKDGCNNLYKPIVDGALDYFDKNKISWWQGTKDKEGHSLPSGHTLSSQIACLNHLFALREDKKAVLAIARVICKDIYKDIDEVLPVPIDTEDTKAFIAFEAVSDDDLLKEGFPPTRGSNCTSIDALILAKRRGGKTVLLPIEWKYTESYGNTNKATEDGKDHPKGSHAAGYIRLNRYVELIHKSAQLKKCRDYTNSVYFFEPFYQLMRQMLWAERMVRYKDRERIKADDFIHVHVVPPHNAQLLDKIYPCSGEDMETTWKSQLIDSKKYRLLSPEDLLAGVDKKKYVALREYLEKRYYGIAHMQP